MEEDIFFWIEWHEKFIYLKSHLYLMKQCMRCSKISSLCSGSSKRLLSLSLFCSRPIETSLPSLHDSKVPWYFLWCPPYACKRHPLESEIGLLLWTGPQTISGLFSFLLLHQWSNIQSVVETRGRWALNLRHGSWVSLCSTNQQTNRVEHGANPSLLLLRR